MKEQTIGSAQTAGRSSSTSTIVVVVLAAWLLTAIAIAASGVLEDPPTPLTPVLIWGPVITFVAVFIRSQTFRMWTLQVNLRWLILYHIVRAGIGTGFLLMSGDELPTEFAVPAGYGDIAVGAAALIVALYAPATTALRRRVVFTWNLVGSLDMLMVFVTAQRLILFGDDPDAMVQLTKFPLLVVPMFVVPIVVVLRLCQ